MERNKNKSAEDLAAMSRAEAEAGSSEVTPAGETPVFKSKDRAPAPSHQYYEIQEGDSLSKIAKDYYGEAAKWKVIYEANKNSIKNPDEVYPGQVIELPDAKSI